MISYVGIGDSFVVNQIFMELMKYSHQNRMPEGGGLTGPSGYQLQLTRNGYTETWKGKVTYFGALEMLGGTYFHQLRFYSPKHPVMYLNFVLPKNKVLAEGGYTFRLVPYEESGSLNESVTEFFLPREDGFPEPARGGLAKIQLDQNGYAIIGDLEVKIVGKQNTGCQLKGRFWLDYMERREINQLSTTNFT